MTSEQPRQVDEGGTFVHDANHTSNGGVTAGYTGDADLASDAEAAAFARVPVSRSGS